MLAKGFAIKKELVNGKTVKEVGLFGDFNKSGARIIEMNDGKAKYTELSSQDIHQLLGIRSNPSDLLERLVPMLKLHKHKSHKRHRSHRRHKRSHRRHKRSHRRHKRSHRRHKRSHKRHRHKSHRHNRHKSHRHKSHKSHRHKSHRH